MSKKKNKRRNNKASKPKKKFTKKQIKRSAVDKHVKNPDAKMRLNKYIANSGICSRRDADIFIKSGNVTVNGEIITQMGYKVNLNDDVRFDGRRINPVKKEYVLLNKPSGFYVTTRQETKNRTVMDLVGKASKSPINPVDKMGNSAKGLLLFTNDGTLEKRIVHKGIEQIFYIELTKRFREEDLEELRKGISMKDGFVKPIEVDYVKNKSDHHLGLEIKSSIDQVVPKVFTKLGYEILNLDRVMYGGLTKKDLPRGNFRHLNKQEIINLGMI